MFKGVVAVLYGLKLMLFGQPEPKAYRLKADPPHLECWNGKLYKYPIPPRLRRVITHEQYIDAVCSDD